MQRYYLVVLMWWSVSYCVFAQTVTVTVDSSKIKPLKQNIASDSMLQRTAVRANELSAYTKDISLEEVYSKQRWDRQFDSLTQIANINLPSVPEVNPQRISEQDIVETINQKVQGNRSLPDTAVPGISDPSQNLSKVIPSLPSYQLEDIAKAQLSPLPGGVTKSKYLSSLDSMRDVNLKENAVRLKEANINASQKISTFTRIPSLIDRSYLEGVLGMAIGKDPLYQITPCWGIHLFKYISVGAGPNLLLWKEQKRFHSSIGAKVFTKVEFFKRRVYLQGEDLMDSYAVNSEESGKSFYECHNFFVGGGWLLSLSTPVTLNLSLMYNVSDRSISQQTISPFIFRIGFSTVKIEK
jgi:hypothetical protein